MDIPIERALSKIGILVLENDELRAGNYARDERISQLEDEVDDLKQKLGIEPEDLDETVEPKE